MSDEQKDESELSDEEMRASVVRLAFEGDPARLDEFVRVLKEAIPAGTGAVMRGSSITGYRWKDGAPFDADGPGTSDLDLTLVGNEIHDFYILDGYYIPGLHTKPLSDKDPDIAPGLVPLRKQLIEMVRRPVNIQATTDFVMYVRGELMGQPYLTLIEEAKDE
jgi:hypothetical protein